MSTRSIDRRYSVRLEWAGEAKRCLVVRFCGEWVGKARSHDGARRIIADHGESRIARDLAAINAMYDAIEARQSAALAWGN